MEHELIDYYDENQKYLGVIDKAIAHKKGLWHKSVHVWIINNGQVLLQKRCQDKSFFPTYYDCSFAGHVASKEDTLTSAIREGKEELGLDIKKEELKYIFTIKEKLKYDEIISNEFVDVYLLTRKINVSDLKYQKEEVESAKYFKIEDLDKLKMLPHYQEIEMLKALIKSS